MIRKRHFILCNVGLIAWLAWRVHQGEPTETVVTLGLLTAVIVNAAIVVKWLRTRDKRPKATNVGVFPWRQWAIGHAVGAGLLGFIALQGYGFADLAFAAILGFGGGNVATVAFWLWDRHTLLRRASSE